MYIRLTDTHTDTPDSIRMKFDGFDWQLVEWRVKKYVFFFSYDMK